MSDIRQNSTGLFRVNFIVWFRYPGILQMTILAPDGISMMNFPSLSLLVVYSGLSGTEMIAPSKGSLLSFRTTPDITSCTCARHTSLPVNRHTMHKSVIILFFIYILFYDYHPAFCHVCPVVPSNTAASLAGIGYTCHFFSYLILLGLLPSVPRLILS